MDFPILKPLKNREEIIWYNENYKSFDSIKDDLPVSIENVIDAENRLKRFASYIKKVFPEVDDGIME